MVLRPLSPAEKFRNELSERLAYDAHLSLPSANMLVGVIVDAMEYFSIFPAPARTLNPTTIENVLSISTEIRALARILDLSVQSRFPSLDDIPLATLHNGTILRIPSSSLVTPNPSIACLTRSQTRSFTLLTYLSIVRYFTAYFGKEGVKVLVEDFNRPMTSNTEGDSVVRKVPGIGPRIVKNNGSGGVQRRTSTGARRRSEQGGVQRTTSARRSRKASRDESVPPAQQEIISSPKLPPGLDIRSPLQPLFQPLPSKSPPPSYDFVSHLHSTAPSTRDPHLGSRWSTSVAGESWYEEPATEPLGPAPVPALGRFRMSVRGLSTLGKKLRRRVRVGEEIGVQM